VRRAEPNPSILDILLLARCRVLVTTSHSTFSLWGAYLGQMPTVYYAGQTCRVNNDGGTILSADGFGLMPAETLGRLSSQLATVLP
jgi:hypothetical protein